MVSCSASSFGDSAFSLSGCSLNSCKSASGDRSRYRVVIPSASSATTVAGLGQVACATSYKGTASVKCPKADGDFEWVGCIANTCKQYSGNRTGFDVRGTAAAVTIDGLKPVQCASNYGGSPTVACVSAGADFRFSGCEPKCAAGSGGRTGYLIVDASKRSASTVGGLGARRGAEHFWRRAGAHSGGLVVFGRSLEHGNAQLIAIR